jgi:thioredoxin-like negative regulator of GroEL
MKKWLVLGIIPFIFSACGLMSGPAEPVEQKLATGQVYVDYSTEVAKKYVGKPHVLYFFANWCPNCRSHDQQIKDNLASLPANAVIFRLDYDAETELKKTYGVTSQTTSVMIGSDGKMVNKKTGASIDDYRNFFGGTNASAKTETAAPIEKNAAYVIYDEKVETMRQGNRHVLFFYADWCPTCVQWEKNLTGDFMNITGNAMIIRADYDKETELKKQYGITAQSTAVFIDENGELVEKVTEPSVAKINEFFTAVMKDEALTLAETKTQNAQYIMYNENVTEMLATTPHVKFFYAAWCPTCVKWEKMFTENLSTLPANTLVVRVDYDSETALKEQYGITKQSNAVFIDGNGKALETIADPSLEQIKGFFDKM